MKRAINATKTRNLPKARKSRGGEAIMVKVDPTDNVLEAYLIIALDSSYRLRM